MMFVKVKKMIVFNVKSLNYEETADSDVDEISAHYSVFCRG
jgi:CRISPR/Cas system-associated protein Cas7 (RAMP superfamily)